MPSTARRGTPDLKELRVEWTRHWRSGKRHRRTRLQTVSGTTQKRNGAYKTERETLISVCQGGKKPWGGEGEWKAEADLMTQIQGSSEAMIFVGDGSTCAKDLRQEELVQAGNGKISILQ